MPLPRGEPHHLVLDRRTIARTHALDLSGIEGRPVQVCPNERMGRRGGLGDVAGNLRLADRSGQKREWLGRLVTELALEPRPIDRGPVEPRWRAGLEPSEPKAAARQCCR